MSIVQGTKTALPWLSILVRFTMFITYIPQISLLLPN